MVLGGVVEETTCTHCSHTQVGLVWAWCGCNHGWLVCVHLGCTNWWEVRCWVWVEGEGWCWIGQCSLHRFTV